MSVRAILSFYTQQGRTFKFPVSKCKKASLLTEQLLSTSMDKILAADAIETPYGDLISKKKAEIIETTVTQLPI